MNKQVTVTFEATEENLPLVFQAIGMAAEHTDNMNIKCDPLIAPTRESLMRTTRRKSTTKLAPKSKTQNPTRMAKPKAEESKVTLRSTILSMFVRKGQRLESGAIKQRCALAGYDYNITPTLSKLVEDGFLKRESRGHYVVLKKA